jgi:hypothetical protein
MKIDNPEIHYGLDLEATGTATGVSSVFAASSASTRNYEVPDAGDDAKFLLSTNLTPSPGDIIYYDGTTWQSIEAGATGYYLEARSTGGAPVWVEKQKTSLSWVVSDPATGTIPGPRIYVDKNIIRLDAYTQPTGSVNFNIWEKPDLISTGSILVSTGTTAVPTCTSVTNFTDSEWASNSFIELEITDVTDDPDHVSVTITTEEA